jgi:hypothetical protein
LAITEKREKSAAWLTLSWSGWAYGILVARHEDMSESKRTSKLVLKKRSGSNSAVQATTGKSPQEIFGQLIGKADHLPADLSTKKSRVLTEQ